MSVRLRFSVEMAFDSKETAYAYCVAPGFKLGELERSALELSESPAPAVTRGRVEVSEALGGD